jgi:hypothetical protein
VGVVAELAEAMLDLAVEMWLDEQSQAGGALSKKRLCEALESDADIQAYRRLLVKRNRWQQVVKHARTKCLGNAGTSTVYEGVAVLGHKSGCISKEVECGEAAMHAAMKAVFNVCRQQLARHTRLICRSGR